MTELSFLLDLLLEHKLPKTARDAVRTRIKEVEITPYPQQLELNRMLAQTRPIPADPIVASQAPSMQAIMARNPDLVPQPVAVVAQTPAAVAAMNSRQQAIAESMSGKVDKNTGRPRKF